MNDRYSALYKKKEKRKDQEVKVTLHNEHGSKITKVIFPPPLSSSSSPS
ncbi:MAG: hypothetical protein M5F18_02505 [Asgard group archaeon]|nr:hypothetical protein [Asgard group archaeon]